MKNLLFLCICLMSILNANAQYCSEDNRFTEIEYFSNDQIDSTMNVVYATIDGNDLAFDIYYPNSNDDPLSERPFILLVHGGGYVAGNRGLMRNTCFEFAKRGFVAATITHRYGSGLVMSLDPIYNAEQDGRAAMRYIVDNAAAYNIDTDWIFTGGESSGANIALAMVYTDQSDWDFINPSISATHGGLDSSGNDLTNTYTIQGVFNNWGSLLATSFDSLTNVSIISFHGEKDPIINIDLNMAILRGGSRWLYQAATNFGHCNSLNIDSLGGHGIYPFTYRVPRASCFFKSVFCETCVSESTYEMIIPNCSEPTSISESEESDKIKVYPNPFFNEFELKGTTGEEYYILTSISGMKIYEGKNLNALNRAILESGIYFLSVHGKENQQTIKLIKG